MVWTSPTRRVLMTSFGGLALAGPASSLEKMADPMTFLAYVGCRTTRARNARGDGIAVYRVTDGAWKQVQLVRDLLNPSYLAFDRDRHFLYTVHGDASEVSAFRIEKDGTLVFLNKVSCQGKNPVHLTPDPTNRFIVVANHLTLDGFKSNVAVLPRQADGSLAPVSDLVVLEGQIGPHRVEQPFAKPHQVEYDPAGRFIAVPDKGCDLVRMFALDDAGKLKPVGTPVVARPGAGPRHIAFTPNGHFAYVVNELDATITAHSYDAASGTLKPFQRLPSTPDSFTGYSTGAEIAVVGRFVYVSNRGDDSLGAFAIQADGRLSPVGWVPSGGKTPRFFAGSPGGHMLYAANEDGDSITAFALDPVSGRLTAKGVAAQTGSPTCIVFSA